LERNDVTPTIDVGPLSALRAARVQVVPAVAAPDNDAAQPRDGAELRPDASVAATGYQRDLEGLAGHLGVLAANARPAITLRQVGIDARDLPTGRAQGGGDAASSCTGSVTT
jgi:hypothetical protein